MASALDQRQYIKIINANELSVTVSHRWIWDSIFKEYSVKEDIDGSFTFDLPSFSSGTITALEISADVRTVYSGNKIGRQSLKVGNREIKTWDPADTIEGTNVRRVWQVSGLSLQLKDTRSFKLDIVHPTTNSTSEFTNIQLKLYVFDFPTISNTSPTSGTFPLSQGITFKWSKSSIGVWRSQTLNLIQIEGANAGSPYYSFNINPAYNQYTIPAYTLKGAGKYVWSVTATDEAGATVTSEETTISCGSKPTASLQSPRTGTYIAPGKHDLTFTWNYSDPNGLPQRYALIYWSFTDGRTSEDGDWRFDGTSTTATVNMTFKKGTYSFALNTVNDDDYSGWTQYTTVYCGDDPSVTLTSPSNNSTMALTEDFDFRWTVTDKSSSAQTDVRLQYKKDGASAWTTAYTASTPLKELNAIPYDLGIRDHGKYRFRVQVKTALSGADWATSPERIVTIGSVTKIGLVSPTDGDNVRILAPFTIQWSFEDSFELGQKHVLIKYKKGSDAYTTEYDDDTTDTSYSFESGTFDAGDYTFSLTVTNNDLDSGETIIFSVRFGSVLTPVLTYPVDVNLKTDIRQIFTWQANDSLGLAQKSYVLQYKKTDEDEWTTVSETTSVQYKSFPANTFTAGDYVVRIKFTNIDNVESDYFTAEFTAIGQTEAPVIVNVTQSAIPTVEWEVDSQDTFEFELYNGKNERIYESGIQRGANIREFTPNIMIPDGNYTIKIRCMNSYGFFTEWMTYSFVLETEKPAAYTCYIFANDKFGVTIARSLELDAVTPTANPSDSATPDAIYVMRRAIGETEWQFIGKLSTEDETVKCDDNTVLKNVQYEYCLRNYAEEAGYTDSNVQLILIKHSGMVIYGKDAFVNLKLAEDANISVIHTPSKDITYSNVLGRVYPLRESSEWLTHSTSFKCFVTFDEYSKLEKMYINEDSLWFKGKDFSFACAIDELSIRNAYLDKGYEVSITISRINEEEMALF